MFKKNLNACLIVFVFTVCLYAKQPPTNFNSYDAMPVSARSIAMGGAGVALINSIDNVFLNPAGLAYGRSESIQVEALVSITRKSEIDRAILDSVEPVNLGFNSFVVLQQQGAISWRTLASNVRYSSGTNYWSRQNEDIKAVTISASQKDDKKNYATGISLSYLYGNIAEASVTDGIPFAQTSSGNGFTVDVGFTAPLNRNMTFGINFENIIGFMWWTHYNSEQLPFGIRTGLGYTTGGFTMLADLDKKFYRFGNADDTIYRVGLEQYLTRVLALRVGAQGPSFSNEDKMKYTYGFELNISSFTLSVANENYKINNENVSKYILSLKTFI
ncbi:MAG: hypothetical protein PHI20_01695 [Endomicrobiaceae bacterium]|jgi:hypothetical protein|nr:hypothetical protein [Endomicrobiaceae bacterium]MDD3729731.1 hypothetical protein [Endomicrobiaceae bacterium]MDD4165522.1 hypothetical protein [Endomicrobiaceae bacterium]